MNKLFYENRRTAFILLTLLIVLGATLYFLLVHPMSKDVKSTESQLVEAENERKDLQLRIDSVEEGQPKANEVERLRRIDQIPTTPNTEEVIRTLEEIEMISGSRIHTISFSYDGTIPESMEGAEETVESETDEESEDENTEDGEAVSEEETTEEEIEPSIDLEEMPEELHIITINLELSSPDYDSYQRFLKGIENEERMMMVNNIQFEQPQEMELVAEEEPDESIDSNIIISLFYYEEEKEESTQ